MAKVTVLMPVYNAEKYLDEAICSILDQTFTDFEFLIIDDGSTENSINIISSYSDSRIRFVKNEQNVGISRTLNRGIELASSDLIARMDADDISLPERLQKQYEYLMNHPECGLVSTHVENISEDGKSLWFYQPDGRFAYFNLTFLCWIYHPSVMYRRQAVTDSGMYPLSYAEDYRLWCKLIRRYKIYNLPEILLKYRVTRQSTSNTVLKKEYRDTEREQIFENLCYYAGNDYLIPDNWIECYRNNFSPICKNADLNDICRCIKEIDVIASYIISKKNVNRDEKAIQEAARRKKEYIFKSCYQQLNKPEKIALLLKPGLFRESNRVVRNWVRHKFYRFG